MNTNCPVCNTEIKAVTGFQLNADAKNFTECSSCKTILVENKFSPEKHILIRLGSIFLSSLTLYFILFTDNTRFFSASLISLCVFIGLSKSIYLRNKRKWKAMNEKDQ